MSEFEELVRERDLLLDQLEAQTRTALESVRDEFLRRASANLEAYRDTEYTYKLLLDSGLAATLDNLGFEQRTAAAARIAQSTGVDLDNLSARNVRALRTSKLELLEARSRIAADKVRATMVGLGSLRRPIPFEQVVETIENEVDRALFGREGLRGDIETEMAAWDRQIQDEIAEEAGLELFIYAGPLDKITRPFCRSVLRAKRAYTAEEIEELNQHPELDKYVAPNVRTYCGGYYCRHQWVAVMEGFAESEGYKTSG